ncbi:MAG: peptidase A24, partial [Methanomicrobiales archaeon]|nr:peptidase A24 [Methanomicrobiales archaeon]
ALIASFLYSDYLDNRGWTGSLGLTGYYHKRTIRWFLPLVLVLPALSWFLLAPAIFPQLIPAYVLFAAIFGYVSYMECQGRFETGDNAHPKPRDRFAEIVGRWYFLFIILIFAIVSVFMFLHPAGWGAPAAMILFLSVFCGVFYTFGRMHLFGGADAWALIFIAFALPVYPFEPLSGSPAISFPAFSVLVNALILNLITPAGIFFINVLRRDRAPLMYMFFGFPVKGDEIQKEWGFVMEDFEEKDGVVVRKFIGFWDAIRRMYAGSRRIYTKDLREHPEEFPDELALYRKAGTVWISYAVPFIIPITAGFITAIIFGDFLFAFMQLIL